MIFAWLAFVGVGAVLLAVRAVANGYLMVMRSRGYVVLFLERRSDERYHLFPTYLLPFVLLRYLTLYVAYSLLLLHERLHTVGARGKTVPLTAKA